MASAIDLSGLEMNPLEITEASKAIFEKLFVDESTVAKLHEILTGHQMKTNIPVFGRMGLVGKKSSGCTPNSVSGVETSEKTFDPVLYDLRLSHCQGDIDQLFKLWKRSSIANKTWEDVEDELVTFLSASTVNAIQEALLRLAWFNDTDNSPVGDEDGNELMTTGTDKTYFNQSDGLWNQIFAAVTAGTTQRYTISENSNASKALQLALDASRALNVLRNLYNKADSRLLASGNMVIQMTRSLFNNWQDYLEDKSLVFTLTQAEQGSGQFSYRGIPIEIRDDWDRTIRAYFDNGTTYYLPHRAILTVKSNIPLITSDSESLKSLDMFYDKKDKTHYIDAAWYLDAKLLEEYMIVAAY